MTEPTAILIVEDDDPTRTFLADNLTADGYDLLVAGTLAEALRTLEYHHVDLAVVDLGLPDGSGLELLRKVRESGGPGARLDRRMPLLVLSGHAGETDRVRGLERTRAIERTSSRLEAVPRRPPRTTTPRGSRKDET